LKAIASKRLYLRGVRRVVKWSEKIGNINWRYGFIIWAFGVFEEVCNGLEESQWR